MGLNHYPVVYDIDPFSYIYPIYSETSHIIAQLGSFLVYSETSRIITQLGWFAKTSRIITHIY